MLAHLSAEDLDYVLRLASLLQEARGPTEERPRHFSRVAAGAEAIIAERRLVAAITALGFPAACELLGLTVLSKEGRSLAHHAQSFEERFSGDVSAVALQIATRPEVYFDLTAGIGQRALAGC